jgi:hypothetical protein
MLKHMTGSFKILLNLIRVLFPQWSFFDQVAYHFELEFKIPNAVSWETISFAQERRLAGILLNPKCNLALGQVSLLEQFAADIQILADGKEIGLEDIETLTTYQMVKSLLQVRLKSYDLKTNSVQFKVVAHNPKEELDVFISHWITLEAN